MRFRIVAAGLFALSASLSARAETYADWWWGGSAQAGQGVNVGQQGSLLFVSWFTYDEAGSGMWVVMSGTLDRVARSVSGTFYRTTGPALGTAFDPAKVVATPVGNGTLTFADMHRASLAWSIDGKSGALDLIRQTFGASRLGGTYEGTTNGSVHCSGMGYGMEPMTTPLHGAMTLTITVTGGVASGVAGTGPTACSWNGSVAQSGQTMHVVGTVACPSIGSGMLDLTLLQLDRVLVGWQTASSATMGMGMGMETGCVQTEQFAVVRSD